MEQHIVLQPGEIANLTIEANVCPEPVPDPIPDPVPEPDPLPEPEPQPVPEPKAGIWTSTLEVQDLPMSGPTWDRLTAAADGPNPTPNLSKRNEEDNSAVFAKALAYARTGDLVYCSMVHDLIDQVIGTEGGDALGFARHLGIYVISADLVGLPTELDTRFRAWLMRALDPDYVFDGSSLVFKNEDRPNNHGTAAGASRAAAALYLGLDDEVARVAQVFRGYLGDRDSYIGFRFKDLSWHEDPLEPVGINPSFSEKEGLNIDGVMPDDQRRCGSFSVPPCVTGYVWTNMQAVMAQAYILNRAGFDTFNWEDRALCRAVAWLFDVNDFPAVGDDTWLLPLAEQRCGVDYWDGSSVRSGKNLGFTDWTHALPAV